MRTLQHFFIFLITLWASNIIIPAAHSQCLRDQQLLLLQFKNSIVFRDSTKLISWNASTDCCSWAGVTCSRVGRVLGLDVSSELSAGIDDSSTLFHLRYLESLNLGHNFLGGVSQSFPSAIRKLLNLRYLNLSQNFYFTKVPVEILGLTRLEVLDFSGNHVSLKQGSQNLHMVVQNLTELRELYLDGVQILERGREWCRAISSSLPKLRVLSMSTCNLSGPLHKSLAKLHSLSVIRLDYNNISAPVPEFFANFSNLTLLSLYKCSLHGTFPKKIFQLASLQSIDISYNDQLDGSLPEFPSKGSLQYLDLSLTKFSGLLPNSIGNLKMLSAINIERCNFTGPIPKSIRNLTQLVSLWMAENNLVGSVPSFSRAKNLVGVGLSHNGLSGTINSTHWRSLTKLSYLSLSYNKLHGYIPSSLFSSPGLIYLDLSRNQFSGTLPEISNVSSHLLNGPDPVVAFSNNNLDGSIVPVSISTLDFSGNQITGKIPNWIWSLSNLEYLNLSCNSFDSLEVRSINLTVIMWLDLHSNQLHGQLPNLQPSRRVNFLDFSRNYFSSPIPNSIGDVLPYTIFLSLSSNNLTGVIPESLCNSSLECLDLSSNRLSGPIPNCLTTMSSLFVLNLRRNNLTRVDEFSDQCNLNTLDISGNQIQGQVLKSLSNCHQLEILNLGNNLITEPFPCFLRNISTLRVLVLRSNKFYGRIRCHRTNGTWSVLQIIDLAHNNFSGQIPGTILTTWQAMMTSNANATKKIKNLHLQLGKAYYQEDTVEVTHKGLERELLNVLTIFTVIDFSCNKFTGPIPKEIGELVSLHALNLSHNAFNGTVPSSLSNLSQLEALDLSNNRLSGRIPPELTKLTFLSFLNLSYNQLVGMIPRVAQFSTFDAASFQGNKGLWGPPLTADDRTRFSPKPEGNRSNPRHEIDWDIICPEIGFACGFGIAIGSLVFCKRWRKWYYRAMYNMLLKIFPQLEQRFGRHRRHVYVHQRFWRR